MLDSQNYGYRIMGDELTTVVTQKYLQTEPPVAVGLLALVLAMFVGGLAYVLPLRTAALALAASLGGYAAIVLAARQFFLADPLFGPAAVALAFVVAVAARYVLEERERRKVEAIFGQYVDPSVMAELVAVRSAEDLRVGGTRRPLSVLFCDVRGFTGLSEKLPPEEVVSLLNDFTERCTKIVFEHAGTVDKYVGDCVMAFWNAPRSVDGHADRAVAAALEIARDGAHELAKRGFGVGVGVCSGDVVVGNVGGARRKQYTAIGDVVNTASRLCSNAPAGTVLIAGSTWELLTEKPQAEHLKPLKVKGREAAVEVYSVGEPSGVASPA
jgi:adenylate cyclase